MLITVHGKSNNIDAHEIADAAEYYSRELFTKKMSDKLELDIAFIKPDKDNLVMGVCEWMDKNHLPREFRISIDKTLPRDRILMTLAHEMTHMKQYATGMLKDLMSGSGIIRWNDGYFKTDDLDYWKQPWEIDAYGHEICLFMLYKKSIGESGYINNIT